VCCLHPLPVHHGVQGAHVASLIVEIHVGGTNVWLVSVYDASAIMTRGNVLHPLTCIAHIPYKVKNFHRLQYVYELVVVDWSFVD
jgi:hypothetical protein